MGIKRNFIYSSILTVSNYLFPLITYPYISRVLGVQNIGICNFVDSIVNYYVLFSMLGINTLAIREIAKSKNDLKKRSEVFSSLFALNSLSTLLALSVYVISIFTIPKLYVYRDLLYIGIFKLLFTYLLIEWLYRGVEDFRYITKRTIIIKCAYVVVVFLLVKEQNDYIVYYFLTVLMLVVNAVCNVWHSRKFVILSFHNITFSPYLRSFFTLGVYMVLTSMYTSFNVAYLGFVSDEIQVGYYTTATKLYVILLSLFTAFTGVMLPRMSSLISERKFDEFRLMINKSTEALLIFVMPIIVFSLSFAAQIIAVLSGSGYDGAIVPMRIVMPLMLIIGYEQIIVIQVLMPLKKDKAILINSIVGAVVGVALNILLVGKFGGVGSSVVWLMSEVVVLCFAQYFVSKYIGFRFPFKKIGQNLILALPVFALCYSLQAYTNFIPVIVLLFGGIIIGGYYYYIEVRYLRRDLAIQCISTIKRMCYSFFIPK